MTIKQLYEWAREHGYEDKDILIKERYIGEDDSRYDEILKLEYDELGEYVIL